MSGGLAGKRRYLAALIDLSGTLHIEDEAIKGASRALERLRASGMKIRFVTNTSKESKRVLFERLQRCGIKVDKQEIYTCLTAAVQLIERHKWRPHLMVDPLAMEDFQSIARDDAQKPDCVVLGLSPTHFNYERMNEAFRLVLDGANLVAIHKSRYYKKQDGLYLGPGPFAEAIEFATGRKSTVVGKPDPNFFYGAMYELGLTSGSEDASRCVMIGDDVLGDAVGAADAGLRAILVKTGKFRPSDLEKVSDKKNIHVAEDFTTAVDYLLQD